MKVKAEVRRPRPAWANWSNCKLIKLVKLVKSESEVNESSISRFIKLEKSESECKWKQCWEDRHLQINGTMYLFQNSMIELSKSFSWCVLAKDGILKPCDHRKSGHCQWGIDDQVKMDSCLNTNTITDTWTQTPERKHTITNTNTNTQIQRKAPDVWASWSNILKLPPSSSSELQPQCFWLKQPVQRRSKQKEV